MNAKKLKYGLRAVDKMVEHVGFGKFTLLWATGHPVVIHISKEHRVVHVLENLGARTEESIKRNIKKLTGV
jgi:hypothetical protein